MHVLVGTATRFCTLGGVWEAVDIDNCTGEVFISLNDRVRLLQLLYMYYKYMHCHIYMY